MTRLFRQTVGMEDNRPRPVPRRAFTLLEILTVTAITALLLSLLLPALARARLSERRTRCLSNLRQWGMAVHLYTVTSKGVLPRRGQGVRPVTVVDRPDDWFNALPPMMKELPYIERIRSGRPVIPGEQSIWSCPEAREPVPGHYMAYAMNMMLSTWRDSSPVNVDKVGPLETMVFMADGPGTHSSIVPTYEAYTPVARHVDMVNIVFLDGHAASFRRAYVGCGEGDPHRSDVRWLVPGSDWSEPGQP